MGVKTNQLLFGCHAGVITCRPEMVNRRKRRAKTNPDAGKLVEMLRRYEGRGKRVWSVVRVPSVEVEDGRQGIYVSQMDKRGLTFDHLADECEKVSGERPYYRDVRRHQVKLLREYLRGWRLSHVGPLSLRNSSPGGRKHPPGRGPSGRESR